MSIFKRGRIYWYKFMWNGELIREPTKQGSDKVARQIEAAHRTSLAKGEVGIRDQPPNKSDRKLTNSLSGTWYAGASRAD